MKRKIIQLMLTEMWNQKVLYALCDDGTVWIYADDQWYQLKAIPQDQPEEKQNAT